MGTSKSCEKSEITGKLCAARTYVDPAFPPRASKPPRLNRLRHNDLRLPGRPGGGFLAFLAARVPARARPPARRPARQLAGVDQVALPQQAQRAGDAVGGLVPAEQVDDVVLG